MADVINANSVKWVGDAASSLGIYALCGTPFMHARPLIFLHHFSFRNSRDNRALALYSFVNCSGSMTVQVPIICSCINSDTAAFAPLSPNFCKPGLRLYCIIKHAYIATSCSHPVVSSSLILCSVVSMLTMSNVVTGICSLDIRFCCSSIAPSALLCSLTSPSWRNCIRGTHVSYG